MTAQFARGPYQGRPVIPHPHQEPHAALLIDFDNVTMGIRSDLTKELKSLLNSDIIKGKVAVQRAYADWRRYPQYIVPLAEASVDLIFAPAYGSSKKNATDIRLAIDALELVFTRSEIGTFILLSGDSDFSSLVLKLKEYGKYVIGVGIRESASDLLVQNCDEYYSYSALTGLTRAGDEVTVSGHDPWELVEMAARHMVAEKDVMRSDRLKQVLLDLDPNFDEKTLGYSKFNRFVQEAANRGLVRLHKMENGQFEIALPDSEVSPPETRPSEAPPPAVERSDGRPDRDLRFAYDLLRRAASAVAEESGGVARDSDVKRRMLEIQKDFDESTYGFSKFSRFLRQAHDAHVIELRRLENGNYGIMVTPVADRRDLSEDRILAAVLDAKPEADLVPGLGIRPRRGSRGRALGAAPPPLLEGQTIGAPKPSAPVPSRVADGAGRNRRGRARATPLGTFDPVALGLPVAASEVVDYLLHNYKGVGRRTGEMLVEELGAANVFRAFELEPARVVDLLGPARGAKLLDAWRADHALRRASSRSSVPGKPAVPAPDSEPAVAGTASAELRPAPRRRSRRSRGKRGGRKRATTGPAAT